MKKLIFPILIVLLITSISAASLTIKSVPEYTVWVTIKDAKFEKTIVQPMQYPINSKGEIFLKYNFEEPFTIIVNLKDGQKYIMQKTYETPFNYDEDVILELYPEEYEPEKKIENLTNLNKNNDTILKENSSNSSNKNNLEIVHSEDLNVTSTNEIEIYPSLIETIKRNLKNIIAGSLFLILIIFAILMFYKTKSLQKKISKLERKIKKSERKTQKLKNKKEILIKTLKDNIIRQEEQLIKMRGGNIPKSKEILSSESIKNKLKNKINNGYATNPHKKQDKNYNKLFFKKRFSNK
jgi:hypothetical protein